MQYGPIPIALVIENPAACAKVHCSARIFVVTPMARP
jgi:hypothetical protein